MTDEEKANLLKEADVIVSHELACFELADLVKRQYDAFIITCDCMERSSYEEDHLCSNASFYY